MTTRKHADDMVEMKDLAQVVVSTLVAQVRARRLSPLEPHIIPTYLNPVLLSTPITINIYSTPGNTNPYPLSLSTPINIYPLPPINIFLIPRRSVLVFPSKKLR